MVTMALWSVNLMYLGRNLVAVVKSVHSDAACYAVCCDECQAFSLLRSGYPYVLREFVGGNGPQVHAQLRPYGFRR